MARVMGDNVNFSFNAVALEGLLESVEQVVTVPEANITSFADAWQNFLAGDKKDVVTNIEGPANQADASGERQLLDAIGGGPKSTVFDPTGSGPGSNDPEYQCTSSGLTGVLIRSLTITLNPGEAARWAAVLQHSGETTRVTA